MFDINLLLSKLSGEYTMDVINEAVSGLVRKGILEQYTDENGEFHFNITEFGLKCGEELVKNPESFLELHKEDEDEGVV